MSSYYCSPTNKQINNLHLWQMKNKDTLNLNEQKVGCKSLFWVTHCFEKCSLTFKIKLENK